MSQNVFSQILPKRFLKPAFVVGLAGFVVLSFFVEDCNSALWQGVNRITEAALQPSIKRAVVFLWHGFIFSLAWIADGFGRPNRRREEKVQEMNTLAILAGAFILYYFSNLTALDILLLAFVVRSYLVADTAQQRVVAVVLGATVIYFLHLGLRFAHFYPTTGWNASRCCVNLSPPNATNLANCN